MHKAYKLIVSFIASFSAAAIGNIATLPAIPTWYAALEKPFFNPPNWLFGPVWTALYACMAVSLFLVWTARHKGIKKPAFIAFGVQIVLNAAWSLTFFGLHNPEAGLVVIIMLFAAIITTMRLFWPISRPATFLLVPYIAWVSFATLLNAVIAVLN